MVEDHQDVPKSPGKMEQKHKGVDTRRDGDSPRRYQSETTDETAGAKSFLWCAKCRKKKKCSELDLREPTRRFLERIKKRSKECKKSDETVAGVSTAPHRESISRRSAAPKKSEESHKQDATVEAADTKDVAEKTTKREKERKERKERKMREKEKQKRRERKERERKREREKRKLEERIARPVDTRLTRVHDEGPVEDRVLGKPPPVDFTKTCCYLCAQNTLAIAAATTKPEQSDKGVQVSAHKFRAVAPTLDKSGSPMLLVRTVQSSVKVKTREISTLCPGRSARKETKPRTRAERKKLGVFPWLTRTKCPAGRHAACETDKSVRRDNAEKSEPRSEKCCRERNA